MLLNAESNEADLSDRKKELNELEARLEKNKRKLKDINKYYDSSGKLKFKKSLTDEIEELKRAAKSYPEYLEKKSALKLLETEIENRKIIDKVNCYGSLEADMKTRLSDASKIPVKREDIDNAESYEREISSLKNQLCGMNILASVSLCGQHSLKITDALGNEICPIDGKYEINEAVTVTVPGVMQMELNPKDIDRDSVVGKINKYTDILHEIYNKFNVDGITKLRALFDKKQELKDDIDPIKNRMRAVIGEDNIEVLRSKVREFSKTPRSLEEISEELRIIDSEATINNLFKRIAAFENKTEEFENRYKSVESLTAVINDKEKEVERLNKDILSSDVPDEYKDIDLKCERDDTQLVIDSLQRDRDSLRDEISILQHNLSDRGSPEDLQNDYLEKEAQFEYQCKMLKHWKHIKDVFDARRAEMETHPMTELAKSFSHYLNIISDGDILSVFENEDKIEPLIYSKNYAIDYDKLSEGTKETVFLAFRLACVDQLFPNGNGVLILDDPFTDMDMNRVAASAKLVSEFAEKHQVIFLTCREEYCEFFGNANVVAWE